MDNTENLSNEISLADLLPIIVEKLEAGGEIIFKPRGISMMPLIRQGIDSVALIRADKVGKKDIILYRRKNSQFVLHRIIGKDEHGYILCGDNQIIKEHGITDDMIIGVMKGIYRGDKYISCHDAVYSLYTHILWMIRLCKRLANFGGRVAGKIKKIF